MTLSEYGEKAVTGLAELELQNFRVYDLLHMKFLPGYTVIRGRNAQGKTSLVEAIYLLATTRVLRGSRDSEAIKHGQDEAFVEGRTLDFGCSLKIELKAGTRKRAFLNGITLPRASDLLGRLPCVAFSSEDLEILRGEPSHRRSFLDTSLSQAYPGYLRQLAVFKRALEQRNALLKAEDAPRTASEVFEAWEAELASSGAALRRYRGEFVQEIAPLVQSSHAFLAPGEVMQAQYVLNDSGTTDDELLDLYKKRRPEEMRRGASQIGPHRDELLLLCNSKPIKLYGSQGQQRTAAISLRISERMWMSQRHGSDPLLILDDVFSDLDQFRTRKLIESLESHEGQVFITCTSTPDFGQNALGSARFVTVDSGKVIEG